MIHTIFFDLDNTLYPRESRIWTAIGERINLYMTDYLEIPEDQVMPLRIKFHQEFGISLIGLQSMFDIDEQEYLDFVHDVDLNGLLTDDGSLRKMLANISRRKIICTNADYAHAHRVLNFFGVRDHFDTIVDIIAMKPFIKPDPEAYQIALDLAGLDSPQGCMFIDDLLVNVEQACKSGFHGVFVGDETTELPTIPDIFGLPALLHQK